jgi:FkbM family methyltransferase
MEKLGTTYGGWYVPRVMDLDENSIIYSAGVGEDISFDLLLSDKYKSHIYFIDPTERALKHYESVYEGYDRAIWDFSGQDVQKDYWETISGLKPTLRKMYYVKKGLWTGRDILKFYKQENEKYVSQSLIKDMFGKEYDRVEVLSVKDLMREKQNTKIDLLKMDIEGAEVEVLNKMLDDEIYPKYLCIEFDLALKRKDPDNSTKKILERLMRGGYRMLKNDKLNITFIYDKNNIKI